MESSSFHAINRIIVWFYCIQFVVIINVISSSFLFRDHFFVIWTFSSQKIHNNSISKVQRGRRSRLHQSAIQLSFQVILRCKDYNYHYFGQTKIHPHNYIVRQVLLSMAMEPKIILYNQYVVLSGVVEFLIVKIRLI